MESTYDRFYRAMLILVGPGALHERLADAYREEIQYIDLAPLSESMRFALETLSDELTKVGAEGDRDEIEMSAAAMAETDATDLATQILDLYEDVVRETFAAG